ncbi:hypothetical protein WME94_25000 [Sorangium sp. So ce429]
MQAICRLVKRWPLALLAAAAMATSCSGNDDGGGHGGQGGQGGSSGATSGSGGSGGATAGSGGAPPGECRVQEDCADESAPCYAPGTAPRCGICMRPEITCSDDAICHERVGPTSICGIEDCMCEPGCIEGCTADSDCEIGQQCAPDRHCTAKECAAPADCPANFDCTGDGTCGRRACTADGDGCEPYCVLGLCYDSLGTCTLPPP